MRQTISIVAAMALVSGFVLASDEPGPRESSNQIPRFRLTDNGERMLDGTTGVSYTLDGDHWGPATLASDQAKASSPRSQQHRRRLVEALRETHILIESAQELVREGRALESDVVVNNALTILGSLQTRLTTIEQELAE